ncbi:Ig-like domain-containing protein [Nakamurella deserti]|uniref:Ig-like domain-containing protein n=1 Tax=Nakamurella deserti TaxID=2164074 RepID=UPI000DBE356B|nr:Ig-like domain-containing protein [Nakamurella deserti]
MTSTLRRRAPWRARITLAVTAVVLAAGLPWSAPAAAAAGVDAQFVFQPATASTPAGYVADTGRAFDATRGYGWVRQDNPATPLDLSANTRLRTRTTVTPVQNRLIHVQYGDLVPRPTSGGNLTPGAWQYVVPNGRYTVTAGVGDQAGPGRTGCAAPCYDSFHTVRAEGVTLINRFQGSNARQYATGSATVEVTDGRLTVDAIGGTNTKLNFLTVAAVTTPPATGTRVDFTDAVTAPPAGYVADWGQPYGPRTSANQGSGLTYGWISPTDQTPVSLVGNGRNRNTGSAPVNQPDARLASFMHMQLGAATGRWELAVTNGAYEVTVAVGDAGTATDSAHWVDVENQNAMARFVPTVATRFSTVTRTVVVADGRLTLSPTGGTNTKIDYVDVVPVDLAGRPYTVKSTPANGTTGAVVNSSVTADNLLNPSGGAVDESTLTGDNVKLTRVADNARVSGGGVTSGGGDTVSFEPGVTLDGNTLYRFEITTGVKDVSGRSFMPFSSVFTTSNGSGPGVANVAFDALDSGAAKGNSYSSVVLGPDGKLYAGSIYGQIYRWTINADGTLGNQQTITTVRDHAVAAGWEGAPNRSVIGLAFDPASTPTAPILWITDNQAYLGEPTPDTTGAVARLTGPNLENYQAVLVNLPRSNKDHLTNSIALKNGKVYFAQGAMNAMGALDGTWEREEHLLSAAVLQLDPAKLPATLPVDVATADMKVPARSGVPAHTGTYDPYATTAPLTLYATGVRNAFDLVFHSNGHLYAPTNGSALGGNTPGTPTPYPASCARRADGGYTGPAAPALKGVLQEETDYVFDVRPGKYYGHPNALRCEYVLAAGNPTGYTGNPLFRFGAYPEGQKADPNFDLAGVYDAGLHASANGALEYRNSSVFGGALAGSLLVVRYHANQEVVAFSVNGTGGLSLPITGITGFTGLRQPLDIAQVPASGNLYVTELTDNPATTGIKLLRPRGTTATAVARIDFKPAAAALPAGYTADTGTAFSATTGFGWVRTGTTTALDMTAQTRDRAVTADQRLRSIIQMQPTGATAGSWEYAVPTGRYKVTFSVGDPSYTDSVHRIQVEGQPGVTFTPTSTERSRAVTVTVDVSDGRLTLDAAGGTNTKLQYVDIDRVSG